jgi:hypothetical protein
MAKKSKVATKNKNALTTNMAKLRRPVVYLPLLAVLGILVYFGGQQYRATRERCVSNDRATNITYGERNN